MILGIVAFRNQGKGIAAILLSASIVRGIAAEANDTIVSPTPLGYASPSEGLEAWINLRVIQKLAHHTSAVVAAVVLFWFVGFIVQHLMHDTFFKRCVLIFDEFVLVCLFVYFAYELFLYL